MLGWTGRINAFAMQKRTFLRYSEKKLKFLFSHFLERANLGLASRRTKQ